MKLRSLYTNKEIMDAIDSHRHANGSPNFRKSAKALTELRGEDAAVSRQLLRHWYRTLTEFTKRNGEPYVGDTVANRKIREAEVKLRKPSPDDWDAKEDRPYDNSCILVIPDQHAPYHHTDAIDFLIAVAAKYRPTRVINLGDEVDNHALSFHDSDPNLDSASTELAKAKLFIGKLAKVFPRMEVCHSNHGSLVYRRAMKHGIPTEYIKTYREILFPKGGGDGWSWHEQIKTSLPDGSEVLFRHQSSGDIMANAAHERCNIVQGHEHGKYEITYRASTTALYWGLVSGCLIDRKSMAFAYGKLFPKKPILGCTVIIDSQPILVPMILDEDGRWTRELGGVSHKH